MDFLQGAPASNECSNSRNHGKAKNFLERRTMRSIWMSACFICPISIVLRTKLLSHDLNVFCCVRLPSRDTKLMLKMATFLKTAVQIIGIRNGFKGDFDNVTFVWSYNTL